MLLHFGAVDYAATVWVNGIALVRHEGGYTPFVIDITPVLRRSEGSPDRVRFSDPFTKAGTR